MSDIKDLQYRALQIANHYDEYNRQIGRKGWDIRDYTDGLVGDIGDLVKAVMAVHERRDMAKPLGKVEHELNDILWSVLILYKLHQLDPAMSFARAMDDLEQRVVKLKREARADALKTRTK